MLSPRAEDALAVLMQALTERPELEEHVHERWRLRAGLGATASELSPELLAAADALGGSLAATARPGEDVGGLADAFAPEVRVNAILPGPFRTDVTKVWSEEALKGEFVPLKRLGEAEEVAPLALHLASAASSYTTGAIIRVDGGITRRV